MHIGVEMTETKKFVTAELQIIIRSDLFISFSFFITYSREMFPQKPSIQTAATTSRKQNARAKSE